MAGPTDDLSLVTECRDGRTDAFGVLVERYQDRLYPTALRLTGAVDDALDLLQDTFLRAFQKLSGFHGDSSFYTWVYRIMVNLALTGRRRRLPRRFRGEAMGDAADPAEGNDPGSHLERAEREALVQRALDRLAADHRVVVVMKEYDGLRYEEIAAALGVPVGTVRSRLHRARCELKGMLRGALGEPDERPSARDPERVPVPAAVGPDDPSSSSSLSSSSAILPFRGTRPRSSLALTPPNHHEA
jgi:RNA polymerase sigma-70 factor (ECF subfamily)